MQISAFNPILKFKQTTISIPNSTNIYCAVLQMKRSRKDFTAPLKAMTANREEEEEEEEK